MYTSPVNNKSDWYKATIMHNGKRYTEFATTRIQAITFVLYMIASDLKIENRVKLLDNNK